MSLLRNFSQTSVLKARIFSFMQSERSSPSVPIPVSANEKNINVGTCFHTHTHTQKIYNNLSLKHSWLQSKHIKQEFQLSSSLERPHTLSILLMKMTICNFFFLGAFKVVQRLFIDHCPSCTSYSLTFSRITTIEIIQLRVQSSKMYNKQKEVKRTLYKAFLKMTCLLGQQHKICYHFHSLRQSLKGNYSLY